MEPLVSIIIPVYNTEKYISKCLSTVRSQTYTNIEVLIIDDGSTDDSQRICRDMEACDKRVRVIHQSNAGVSSARNTGIDNAIGKYIAFIDSDDIVSPIYIQTLVENLRNSVFSMCAYEKIRSHDYQFVNEAGNTKKVSAKNCAQKLLRGDFPVAVWAAIFLRDMIGEIRFPVGIRNNEDKEFLYHYLLNNENGTVSRSDQKLYGYYIREGSAVNTKWNGSLDLISVADRMMQLTVKKHPKWKQDAVNNSIMARTNTMKWIIQTEDIHSKKETLETIRKEVLNYGYPKKAGIRTRVEYVALRCGMWAYRALFLLYRLLYSEEDREKKNLKNYFVESHELHKSSISQM